MSRLRNILAVVVFAACWLSGGTEVAAQRWADSDGGVRWLETWGRFRAPHVVILGLTLTSAFVVRFAGQPEAPRWRGPILFDSAARHGLRADTASTRRRIGLASDVLLISTALGTLSDAAMVAWWRRGSPEVAGQLMGMNSLAFAMAAWAVAVSKVTFARERPSTFALRCAEDPTPAGCGANGSNLSFLSGHSAMAFTGAALTCVQHRYLALHDSRAAGGLRCALGLSLATTTALLRVAADRHWVSDVVFGAVVGFAAGWVLPRLVYFRGWGREVPPLPTPYVARGGAGLTYSGVFR